MGFFNNIGVTIPTKDNIYSLFNIPYANGHNFGRIRKKKTSTGLRIFIDNEICYNIKGITYISESNDYDTEEIVKFLIESHLCIEDIHEIILFFTTKSREYMPGDLGLIFQPEGVIVEIALKNGDHLSRIYIDPIEM